MILDSIDGKILLELRRRPLGIMELTRQLEIKHTNLKVHLSRLSEKKLIRKTYIPLSRKTLLSIPKSKKMKTIFDLFK